MEQDKIIKTTSLLLSFVAGFCDTVTFVAAGELFSAHVTGNFIVFAYNVIKNPGHADWQKLLTFPVFIVSVILGGRIARRFTNKFTLIILEGILLLISGIIAIFVHDGLPLSAQMIAMIIVVAMGFQNTFGKLYSKSTYGLTTVMTGNVTQASLDIVKSLSGRPFDQDAFGSLKKQLILISGFLLGCLGGGWMASRFGLPSVIFPGFMLLLWLVATGLICGDPADQ